MTGELLLLNGGEQQKHTGPSSFLDSSYLKNVDSLRIS